MVALPGVLRADEFHFGLSYNHGSRVPDALDDGYRRFHSSLRADLYHWVESDGFYRLDSVEGFFRFAGPLGETNYFGLTGGVFRAPHINVREVRSDGVMLQLRFRYDLSYFLFTYHHVEYLRRGRSWEAGFGYGFIPLSYWYADGYRLSAFNANQMHAFHTGRFGLITRLETGVSQSLKEHLFLRSTWRFTYAYAGPFQGHLNDFSANYYYLKNDGLALLNAFDAALATREIYTPTGPTVIGFIREKAAFTAGVFEWNISFGVRF